MRGRTLAAAGAALLAVGVTAVFLSGTVEGDCDDTGEAKCAPPALETAGSAFGWLAAAAGLLLLVVGGVVAWRRPKEPA